MYCKSCGAELTNGAKFCGKCGAQQETQMKSQTAYQTRARTQQNPNMGYQPAPKKKSALGKIVGGIVGAVVLLVVILFVIGEADGPSSAYAKIDCELTGKADEFEWNLLGINIALQMNVLEQHDFTQADKNAIQYAIKHIEKNMQPLENKGVYQVVLYKDYYNEHDKNGWAMWLRYNRTIEDFDAVIARF